MPYDPKRCRPNSPHSVGASSIPALRHMLNMHPHLRPCPITTPPWQWLPLAWCEKRCRDGRWIGKREARNG